MKEKILNKEVVFDDYFQIEKWVYQYEKDSGELTEPVDRMLFQRTDSAAVIVYNTDTEEVLLVKQFRHCTYEKGPGWIIEAVAGMIDNNETPEVAVRREAIEEIGYNIHNVEKVATVYASPGCTTERMHVYYAEVTDADNVAQGGGLAAESEYISVVTMPIDEFALAMQNDTINDSKTVIAGYYLLKKMGR